MVEITCKDFGGKRDNIRLTIPADNNLLMLRKRLFVELMRDDRWIPEQSICMWVPIPGNQIRIVTERIQDASPNEPPSLDTDEFEQENPHVTEGDLQRSVVETIPKLEVYYYLLGDYLQLMLEQDEEFKELQDLLPKDHVQSVMNVPEGDQQLVDANSLWLSLLFTVYPYWPKFSSENNGLEFTYLLYDVAVETESQSATIKRELKRRKSMTQNKVSEYESQFDVRGTDKTLRALANRAPEEMEFQLTYVLLEVRPKASVRSTENFVNLRQLFYYLRLDSRIVLKAIPTETKRKPLIAIRREFREQESETLIERWLKTVKVREGQMVLRVRVSPDESRYITMRIEADGHYTVACSWLQTDTRSNKDRIDECSKIARSVMKRINQVSGKRPVFVTSNGLPNVKHRYRVNFNLSKPTTARILQANAQLILPISVTRSNLIRLIKSREHKSFFEAYVTVGRGSERTVNLKYTKNETEGVVLSVDTKSPRTSHVAIRGAKGLVELRAITMFVKAMIQLYVEKYGVKVPKEWSASTQALIQTTEEKQQSLFDLYRKGKVSKLAILKHFDQKSDRLQLFETESSYVTECQRHRQPLILTDREVRNLQDKLTYVMRYRGFNFVCDPQSEFPWPGLGEHDQRLIPCCFAKDQRKKPRYRKHIEGRVDRNKRTRIAFHDYILTDEKKIIPPGRIGKLHGAVRRGRTKPELLDRLFNTSPHLPDNLLFVRIGIEKDESALFRAVLALIDERYFQVKDTEKNEMVENLKQDLIQEIEKFPQLFLSLNKGAIKRKYKTAKAFGRAIETGTVTGHRELADLIHKVKRVNLFIFDVVMPDTGLMDDMSLICHMTESTFHEDFVSLFLIHREGSYEPIMLIHTTKNEVVQRTFAYQKGNDLAPANIVYDLWRSICVPLAPIHVPEGFSRPLTAYETKRKIDKYVKVIGQVVPDDRCEALVVKLKTEDQRIQAIIVPVVPSDPIYHSVREKQIKLVRGVRHMTPLDTKNRLELIADETGLNVRPRSQILDDHDRTVALLLENTLIAPTKSSDPIRNLPIEPNARYYASVDEYIRSGERLVDDRVQLARVRKRQSDFWYNLLVQLALHFQQNPDDKKRVLAIVDDNNAKDELHLVLATILNKILNRRRLRRLFPVNILGINERIYKITSAENNKTYIPCEEFNNDARSCSEQRHCELANDGTTCQPTPEQRALNRYYFAILHEIATDPAHHLVEGKLGRMLKLVDKMEIPEEEYITVERK